MNIAARAAQGERRRHHRFDTMPVATLNCGGRLLPCIVTNVSRGGARVRLLEPADLPRDAVVLQSSRYGTMMSQVVWQLDLQVGLKFAVELADHALSDAPLAA